jgi:pimeloyl-ACP methyl ester carboxylesterase
MSRAAMPEEATPMTQATSTNILDVPGASLYYEVTGSGPVLALIGLPMDHTGFGLIVPALAERYRVVTYDPRGFLNSRVDDPDAELPLELVAEDVHRVLAAVTDEPALVLGSSGGAVTGLALIIAHPEQVRALVAHEPPTVAFLPDAEKRRAQILDIRETNRREGQGAAWMKFFILMAPEGAPPSDPAAMMGNEPPTPEQIASGDRMLSRSMVPTVDYRPDPEALRRLADRIVIGVGANSVGQYAHRTALALAERAGLPVVEFPGDHGGFAGEPGPFAARLIEELEARV